MKQLEQSCYEIIESVGDARKDFIEAISHARDYEFDEAREKVNQGNENYLKGHKIHADLISQEANGTMSDITMLLLHAEDQLMSAESLKIMAEELILNYEKIQQLEIKMKWQ